jgi:dipeptidyl-peptidase-4
MAQRGFVVFSIDGPGSGGRGRDCTRRLFRQTGKAELEGQLRGVQWLRAQTWAGKIGIWGWSYGGYMTCYAMTHSDAFAAGVAVAPVTDWRFYDTIYTERYLRTPRENPDGYRLSSPDPAALRGRLLVVHGLSDDNVHWQNTVQFLGGLIRHNAKFDVQVYPAKDHGIWGREVRTHLFETMTAFFERELR